jgi:hypothetical protein
MATVRWGMLSTAGIGRVVASAIRDPQEAAIEAVRTAAANGTTVTLSTSTTRGAAP